MGLNIKNEEVHRLAREVAQRTGETMTHAIQTALEERLARLSADKAKDRAGAGDTGFHPALSGRD